MNKVKRNILILLSVFICIFALIYLGAPRKYYCYSEDNNVEIELKKRYENFNGYYVINVIQPMDFLTETGEFKVYNLQGEERYTVSDAIEKDGEDFYLIYEDKDRKIKIEIKESKKDLTAIIRNFTESIEKNDI